MQIIWCILAAVLATFIAIGIGLGIIGWAEGINKGELWAFVVLALCFVAPLLMLLLNRKKKPAEKQAKKPIKKPAESIDGTDATVWR